MRWVFAPLFLMLFCSTVFAGPGALFSVAKVGNQLTVNTTIPNKTYPFVGIRINAPGYTISGSGVDCLSSRQGYCLFSASDTTPASISITGPTGPMPITLCLNGYGGLSCQALTLEAVDTLADWNGVQYISNWGAGSNTATYGQLITAPEGRNVRLLSFTAELRRISGTPHQYQVFVYRWDISNKRVIGVPLYSSAVTRAPSTTSFSPVTIRNINAVMTPGETYIVLFTASTIPGQTTSAYAWGARDAGSYPVGTFVFQNNGTNFDRLRTNPWTVLPINFAFTATFAVQ